jgi:hypothetical protein
VDDRNKHAVVQMLVKGFATWVICAFFAPLLLAQNINIRVLNGRNGKPIANECLNISLGSWHGADIVAPTDKSGVRPRSFLERMLGGISVQDRGCRESKSLLHVWFGKAMAPDHIPVCSKFDWIGGSRSRCNYPSFGWSQRTSPQRQSVPERVGWRVAWC